MKWPGGVAVTDSGIVFVADTGNNRIQAWGFAGLFVTAFGSYGSDPGQFSSPRGVSVIPNGPYAGMLAVADTGNDRIQIISRTNNTWTAVAVIGTSGTNPGQLSSPTSVSVWGDYIFVADTGNERIQRLTLDGNFAGAWGGEGTDGGCTSLPTGILANAYGVFVVESGNGRVEHFTRWGALVESFGTLSTPTAIAIDGSAKLYVTEAGAGRLARFTPAAAAAPPVS
ncbi:MAG: NHL repeat-containing protein [Actinobacteria bacterium]|nr:NHL repeat-containing protein [Actinomycetota bacterium]